MKFLLIFSLTVITVSLRSSSPDIYAAYFHDPAAWGVDWYSYDYFWKFYDYNWPLLQNAAYWDAMYIDPMQPIYDYVNYNYDYHSEMYFFAPNRLTVEPSEPSRLEIAKSKLQPLIKETQKMKQNYLGDANFDMTYYRANRSKLLELEKTRSAAVVDILAREELISFYINKLRNN